MALIKRKIVDRGNAEMVTAGCSHHPWARDTRGDLGGRGAGGRRLFRT